MFSHEPVQDLVVIDSESRVSSSPSDKFQFHLTEKADLRTFPSIQRTLLSIQKGVRLFSQGNQGEQVDDALARFVDRALRPSQPISSKTLIEEAVGGRSIGYAEAVASSLVETGLCQWGLLLKRCIDMIDGQQFTGLVFIKQRFYDETPLRLRIDKSGQHISKVLQSNFRIALVLRNNATNQIVSYFGFVPTWLQAIQEKKAETIMQAQLIVEKSVAYLDECSRKFKISVQMVTTDRAGENFKCESGINRLSPHFRKLHLPCDVHKTSTCINSMFKLVDDSVTGIVNLGLMFRPGGTLRQFHQCIKDEIRSKLQVVVGPPPDGYTAEYRHQVYELFLGKNYSNQDVKKKHQLLRIRQVQTLNYFLNGDIQSDAVVWYAPFEIDLEDAIKLVCKYVPYALLPSAVAIFPRHRWHGCEIPIDQLGILSSHHNLLKHACWRFLKLFRDTPAEEPKEPKPDWAAAALNFMKAAESVQPIADASEVPSAENLESDKQNSAPKAPSWEEFNRSVRAMVARWISSDQTFILPLLRFACSPTIGFMFQCLKIASEAWECQQEHAQLTIGQRKYRVLEAFLGQDLESTFADISERMHMQIPALPLAAHTRYHCVLLFCLMAREASSLHFLIRKIRSGFPYKLFGCLAGGLPKVLESPQCLHDPLTNAFMEEFGPIGLDSPEAEAALHVLAEMALVDIAAVESRHASIRRALEASSVQTWRATLQRLSADFASRQSNSWRSFSSKRFFRLRPKQHRKPGRRTKKMSNQDQKKRTGGGGALQGFLKREAEVAIKVEQHVSGHEAICTRVQKLEPG